MFVTERVHWGDVIRDLVWEVLRCEEDALLLRRTLEGRVLDRGETHVTVAVEPCPSAPSRWVQRDADGKFRTSPWHNPLSWIEGEPTTTIDWR
jgi:hypothetical protein